MTSDGVGQPPALEVCAAGLRWLLLPGQVLRIGRGLDNDVVLADDRVSRHHGEIRVEQGEWVYAQLGANGAFAPHLLGPRTALAGPLRIHLADPDGPALDIASQGASHPSAQAFAPAGAVPTPPPALSPAPSPAPAPAGAVPLPRTGELRIGRAAENDVVLTDLLVSRHHARVVVDRTGTWVEDLGARNGTQVNGSDVTRTVVGDGDVLTVGTTRFALRDGQLAPAPDQESDLSLVVGHVSYDLPSGKRLLDDVSLVVEPRSLVAVVGPSGAGKSTLLRALTGARPATSGTVRFAGRDLYADYDELRSQIGLVPQEDVVHRQLTARTALRYAAELRFPPDLDRATRLARVEEVIAELGLTEHADTRIEKLSGGQRKRASVAMELLTRPSLLFLDEPTSGLDPGLDKQVMSTLRTLADGGRTVVVVTHSVDNLDQCDAVLLLAPGGKVAYYGPPSGLLAHFGRDRYADVFVDVTQAPEHWQERFRQLAPAVTEGAGGTARGLVDPGLADRGRPGLARRTPGATAARRQQRRRQLSTLVRRHVRVLAADRSYALSMLLLPAVLAVLAMVVPGDRGFGPAIAGQEPTGEARQLLVIMMIGAAFMGMSASIRELVGERAIFVRERAVGLSPDMYLVAKLCVFAVLVTAQSAVLVTLVLLRKPGPTTASVLGSGPLELVVACAACALAAVGMGLLFSAVVTTSEQVMPLLVVAVMTQLVLCGGLFPVAGRAGLEQLAWLAPARWGFAAAASSVDLAALVPGETDALWAAGPWPWLFAMAMLGVIGVLYCLGALWRLTARRA
ncbi:MAG: ATP-binding cassette domain-containing protein [Cellulomonadaceae bacterium]